MTTNALAIRPEHIEALSKYKPEELALIKQTVAAGCTDTELAYFLYTAQARKLNPWARQIYVVKYGGKMSLVTGIDGLRSIAERAGNYAGSDEPVYGPITRSDGVEHPEYVKVTVYKIVQGHRVPFTGVAYWDEFRRIFNGKLGDMWQSMPRNQLAKCAEGQALRKGFAEQMEGLEFSPEEYHETLITEGGHTVVPGTGEILSAPHPDHPAPPSPMGERTVVDRILTHCTVHDRDWASGTYGFQHPTDEKNDAGKTIWCSRKTALGKLVNEERESLGMEAGELAEYIKAKYGAPISGLDDVDRVAVLLYLRGLGEQRAMAAVDSLPFDPEPSQEEHEAVDEQETLPL